MPQERPRRRRNTRQAMSSQGNNHENDEIVILFGVISLITFYRLSQAYST